MQLSCSQIFVHYSAYLFMGGALYSYPILGPSITKDNAARVVTDSSRVGGFWYKHTGLSFFFIYIMSIKA